MKKNLIIPILLAALLFASCSGGKKSIETAVTEEKPQQTVEMESIPQEEEPQNQEEETEIEPSKPQEAEKAENYCTLSVSCGTIFDNIDKFDERKVALLGNGTLFPEKRAEFAEGESVFDVLLREMRENKIHLEFVNTPVYDSVYIEGIGNIYEFDCGELSGWMYRVNGEFPNFGCSKYILKNGDKVEFVYTCDLGKDVGGGYSQNNGG